MKINFYYLNIIIKLTDNTYVVIVINFYARSMRH